MPDTVVVSDSGHKYNFNINARLGDLLVKALLKSGQLSKDRTCDFDYDNVLLPCEKYDAQWSYKKCRGYFPGVAMADGLVVGVENRDVRFIIRTILTNDRDSSEEEVVLYYNQRGSTPTSHTIACGYERLFFGLFPPFPICLGGGSCARKRRILLFFQ